MAKSTFGSENVKNTDDPFGPLFEVSDVEKLHAAVAKSTFESQNVTKHVRLRSTFVCSDVEKLHAAVAKSTFDSQNVTKHRSLDHFLSV